MSVTAEKHSKPKDDKAPEMFPLNIKIKQEKTTSYEDSSKSETVDKLSIDVNLTNIFSTTITSSSGTEKGAETVDVKPSIEPLKSSNEILTELFRVFNAAPPEIIEDDSNDVSDIKEKKKKKHKHRKKSKKKKEGESETDQEQAEHASEEDEVRVKRKKLKKEKDRERRHDKHEKHKRKHRGETLLVTVKQEPLDKDEKNPKHDEAQSREISREQSHTKHVDTKPKDSSILNESKVEESKHQPLKGKIQIKSLKDSAIFKELATGSSNANERDNERNTERDRHGTKSGHNELRKRKCSGSDFSLSDGDDAGKSRYYDFYQKKYNSFYASYEQGEEERQRQEQKRHRRSADRDRDRDRRRRSASASRSRSRSHSPEQFDKQKLLEIARKNAISMLKKGTLPGAQNLDGESKTKLISKMRASGKSIEELTEFCKKISNKDNFNDLSSVSSDESDHDADGASKVFHHPFQLKEPAPIVMNIRNATTIQPKSAEEKKALLMQFPVSSGAHHRNTETEWVPVEPKKPTPVQSKPMLADSSAPGKSKLKAIMPPSSTFVPQKMPDFTPSNHAQSSPSVVTAQNVATPHVGPQPLMGHPSAGPSNVQPLLQSNDISKPYHSLHVPPLDPQTSLSHSSYNGIRGPESQSLPLPVDTTIPPPSMKAMLPNSHTDQHHHQQRMHFPLSHIHYPGSPGLRSSDGHGYGSGPEHGSGHGNDPAQGHGHRHGHGPGLNHGRNHEHGRGHGPHQVDGANYEQGAGPIHGLGPDPGHGTGNCPSPVYGVGNSLGSAHGPGHGYGSGPGHGPDSSLSAGFGRGPGPGHGHGPALGHGPGHPGSVPRHGSGPGHTGSVPGHGPGPGYGSGPRHTGSFPGHDSGPGHGSGQGHGPGSARGLGPGHGPGHGPGQQHGPGHGSGSGHGNGPSNVFQNEPDAPLLDVSQIVSQRLNAMRKLQENPSDPEARQLLYNTQKDMSTWASSKVMPGQFVGSTGVNCLSQRELAEGYQPWATRDMMKQSAPVTGGMGMHLLQKMGWQPGEGLGKEKNGSLQPLLLDVKLDKRGLGEGQDKARTQQFPGQLFTRRDNAPRPPQRFMNVNVNTDGKHPVSILGEYATKRKWIAPRYELVHESGPGHSKSFVFKVLVNGLEYQPAISNNTKKEAKATAAKFCLQQLGVMIT